jgi:threonine dehydratase
MRDRLFQEILHARQRVYTIGSVTPTERLSLPLDAEVWIKREDLSPIYSYKWRGATNRMALLTPEQRRVGVICASAGNHAQGVALAARRTGVHALIYMPISTPATKLSAVRRHGADSVEIVLTGDDFQEASLAAHEREKETGRTFIHAYDDLRTMGGQGTLADEVVMSGAGPFDVAYLQIGGGGMAASVACWLKYYYPGIHIVGVEGVDQASMQAALKAGKPVALDYVDVFCDGTAVGKAGDLTLPLCRELIDEFMTVTNEEVCAAIQAIWEGARCLSEPAGAMGVAGLLKHADRVSGKRVLTVLCGANLDFGQLARIVRSAGIGARKRRYYRFIIGECPGTLVRLLETVLDGMNIIEFQYGKNHPDEAKYVIGVEASLPEFELLERRAREQGVPCEDVTSQDDVEFRMVRWDPDLLKNPMFLRLEFPERAGALRDFLERMRGTANICLFNYLYTGERVGRALIAFEFESDDQQTRFRNLLTEQPYKYHELDEKVRARLL